jgi:hypothetical protein
VADALPSRLASYLADALPRFSGRPDADWAEGLAAIHDVDVSLIRRALDARFPDMPAIRPTIDADHRDPPAVPTQTGYDRVIAALTAAGHHVPRRTDGQGREFVRTKCPAHADVRPSLIVTCEADTGAALVRCHGGCHTRALCSALGLSLRDLFTGRAATTTTPRAIIATYDYHATDGTVVGRKVRYAPKTFRWQIYKPAVSLYRLPSLTGAQTAYVVEGERSADRLASLDLIATCGPSGASRWLPEWSSILRDAGCREVIILPDHDDAGRKHAAKVASLTHALGIIVRVVSLSGLPSKGDVIDWLDAGHTLDDLRMLIAETPV